MSVKKRRKVFVAMSGGVDSSVSSALLKKAGFDVTGVYMKQWAPEILGRECVWKTDRQDALRVAAKVGIPFETWDFSEEYEKEVAKYMIDSYKKGITPNPDVMCNKIIKFGLFFDKAMERGADYIATGHYAQVAWQQTFFGKQEPALPLFASRPGPSKSLLPRLLKAKDKNKDQTYFLWTLTPKHLVKILFPVGGLEKPEVRKIAKKFKLENAEKKDSQGVCFVGELNMKEFLQMYIKPMQGKILSLSGKVLGEHDGVYYYTIGQRHGLNITDGGGPYFVVKKNIAKNIIYVGKTDDLLGTKAKVKNINWIREPKFSALLDVRIRYRAPLVKATLDKAGNVTFKNPQSAITSGQSAVFYKGNVVLGGGVIV